jgi:hypothetical protein
MGRVGRDVLVADQVLAALGVVDEELEPSPGGFGMSADGITDDEAATASAGDG